MAEVKKIRFCIEPLEERLAPAAVVLGFNAHHNTIVDGGGRGHGGGGNVVLGFNAHHDTVVATGGGAVVLGFNAHHDTIVVSDASQVVLGANAHHNTIVVEGSTCCTPCDTKSQPCC